MRRRESVMHSMAAADRRHEENDEILPPPPPKSSRSERSGDPPPAPVLRADGPLQPSYCGATVPYLMDVNAVTVTDAKVQAANASNALALVITRLTENPYLVEDSQGLGKMAHRNDQWVRGRSWYI